MISDRYDIMQLFDGFVLAAEIGTDQGLFASGLLASYPNMYLIAVDCWKPWTPGDDRAYAKERFAANMAPHAGRYSLLQQTSAEASKSFRDGALDFVYVDADHDRTGEDIEIWWPKVRVGGTMAGHDFDDYSQPVVAFAKQHRLDLQVICDYGGEDRMDRHKGWAHPTWYWRRNA